MSAVGPAPLRAATPRALAGDARSRGTPLIDDGGATFVWLGGDPAPSLVGDWNDWDAGRGVSLERVGRGVHAARLSVPDDAYLEYQLQHRERRAPDPLNRAPFPNGIGGINSCFWMPRAPRHDLARRRRGAPAGLITSHRIPTQGLAVGRHRAAWLYRPAVGTGPFPLLVVLDGRDYLRRGRLDRVLDNLIADGRIAPLAAVFVDNAGPARMVEYGATDTTVAFLAGVVVPFAARHLGASLPADWAAEPSTSGPWELVAKTGVPSASPGPVGILGASMGGLMALHAALRLPGLFGRVLAQSGAWDAAGLDSSTKALVRDAPPTPIRVWMDCGRIEWLHGASERMAGLLAERGYDVAYQVYQGGHNYRCWVQDVVGGLALLYPPEDTPGAR